MPGYGARYWADRTASNRRRTFPAFRGRHTADVVVVGGGLTGCTTAFVLANAGLDVILLDADRIAGGATAGSLGAILPEPDSLYRAAEAATGRRVAKTTWKEAHRSAIEFASALKKLPTKCDLGPAEFLINANPRRFEPEADLTRERAARKEAGLEAPWISGAAARTEIGTESSGALRLRGAFLFDPVRAALGLAAAAEAKGARIFERSEARRTKFARKFVDVVLSNGQIRTRGVVVATGEPGRFVGQLRRHVRRLDGYAVVTAPLSAAMKREMGKLRTVVTETGTEPHWWRPLPDDRLLFAGALSRPAGPRLRDKTVIHRTGQLMYELSVLYPVISGLPAAWGWDTPVVTTPDGLPWIGPHRNYPFHFLAMAFGWHGDGMAWLAARAALRHFKGEGRKEDEALGFVRHL